MAVTSLISGLRRLIIRYIGRSGLRAGVLDSEAYFRPKDPGSLCPPTSARSVAMRQGVSIPVSAIPLPLDVRHGLKLFQWNLYGYASRNVFQRDHNAKPVLPAEYHAFHPSQCS